MSSFRKATLRDVARHAGVSPTTVSEFLSGQPNACSAATATRIRQAVEELHYAPSALGASLRKARTRTIGVSLLFPRAQRTPRGNYLLRLWSGITEEAVAAEHSVLFYEDQIRRDLSNYRVFLDGRVDGVIFHPVMGDLRPVKLAEAGLPVAVISESPETYPGCITVVSDEDRIVHAVMEHLLAQGHRRIAHLAGPTRGRHEAGTGIARQRRDLYRAICEEAGIFDPELLFEPTYWSPNTEEEAADWRTAPERWRRLASPPTAVFCCTDAIALRLIEFAAECGWSVPEELSVVGIDNTLVGELQRPALTTVDYPVEEQGRVAIRALLARISGSPLPSEHLPVDGAELIVRDTSVRR
ncbi:MAG: LacI family DNA-binding transcriptional regulator [Capsulimonadales bacterium]|nr:LacI family DNA-binding transcriptional regulator [Capsulimonadales bacterium]